MISKGAIREGKAALNEWLRNQTDDVEAGNRLARALDALIGEIERDLND